MISFCIPAHNETALIGATVRAIRAAAEAVGQPFEIVVADDGSTDNTGAVAAEAGARVVRVEHRKISATRNSAAASSSGDILFFIDADTIIEPHHLREALDLLARGCVGGGALITMDGPVPRWSRLLLAALLALYRPLRLSAGCFMFCTRAAFDASGGYPEELFGGEEVIFAQRLKKQGRFRLIRSKVVTSGRKLRTHSMGEIIGALGQITFRGPGFAKKREHMGLWYEERREDPMGPASSAERRSRSIHEGPAL